MSDDERAVRAAARPALAELAAHLEKLRSGTAVTQVHAGVLALQPSRLIALGVPEVRTRARVRTEYRHFSTQWTDLRELRKLPPLDGMVLPSVVVMSRPGEEAENIATAERLWHRAMAEQGPRRRRGPAPAGGGRGAPAQDPPAAVAAVEQAAAPGRGGPLIVLGLAVIAGGGFIVNAGLDRPGPAGVAVAAIGALVAAVGGDLAKRGIRRVRTGRSERTSGPAGPP
ncbi:hypothetical protein [Catellatospora tritici]|uniref:hypothetical protein n=1 Tax=Catellatospora tritici TaxID=2851566 RepID=UPI001C2D6EC1|nr:hypothetical protein [Catellatospora tritici]MBV1855813.1 hypothetical protein [Catellatospora tritici]